MPGFRTAASSSGTTTVMPPPTLVRHELRRLGHHADPCAEPCASGGSALLAAASTIGRQSVGAGKCLGIPVRVGASHSSSSPEDRGEERRSDETLRMHTLPAL